MNIEISLEENEKARSNFIKELVQFSSVSDVESLTFNRLIPKRVIQFWHNLDELPDDVYDCIETWKSLEQQGIERLIFDHQKAKDFIYQKLGIRYKQAYDKCYHPAMQSDYFRLCYIFVEGGCYIDADDVYSGAQIQHLFSDGRLKIQPLCYDAATHLMVPPQIFAEAGANTDSWIFYFNNNPLIASSAHPLIELALDQATLSLEKKLSYGFPEIQSTTGPGNLTKSIFDAINNNIEVKQSLLVLSDWEDFAKSRWELSYRNDSRNWRLSNCRAY